MLCSNGLVSFVLYSLLCLNTVECVQEHVFHFSRVSDLLPQHYQRQSVRTALEQGIAIHLYEGDIIYLDVCTERWVNISFSNLTYSNDGAKENISVHVDSHFVGQFITHSLSDWGAYWHTFYGSGYLGNSGLLPPGKHVIAIRIVSSDDCYGVELGTLVLTTSKRVNSAKLWCGKRHAMLESRCLPRVKDNVVVTSRPEVTPLATTLKPPRFIQVRQLSHPSDCIDKQNIKIAFMSNNLNGTQITVKHEEHAASHDTDATMNMGTSAGRQCKSSLWQLGKVDGKSFEFGNIYPGESYTLNITAHKDPTKRYPTKILPFLTKEIILHFGIPKYLNMKEGSAYFVIGLVNLTKNCRVGLQYYNPMTDRFSESLFLTFTSTYQVMGWHLPEIGRSTINNKNTIKLQFVSDANVIMFDFLKLDFSLREERKQNELIARRGNLKIRGLRYTTSPGVTVVVDNLDIVYNIEDIVIYFKKFSRYEVVLRIHHSGRLYPYTSYAYRPTTNEQPIVDVTGFVFSNGGNPISDDMSTTSLSSLYIDTNADIITANYQDGTTVRLKLTSGTESTRLTVIDFPQDVVVHGNRGPQTLYFLSTHVNDAVAAINDITAGDIKAHVTSDLMNLSGEYNYTLTRSSQSSVFYANNVFNIQFPR